MTKLLAVFVLFLGLWQPCAAAAAEERRPILTLATAVREALENNPEISLLRERLRVMQARARQSSYLEDPEVVIHPMGVPH